MSRGVDADDRIRDASSSALVVAALAPGIDEAHRRRTRLLRPSGGGPHGDEQAGVERLRHATTAGYSIIVVARDGRIVGLCTANFDVESVRFGHRSSVEDLAVHSERRSCGIGKRLLDAAKDLARERGATHLE